MNRWHAFSQLILSRLREFYREPEAVFWVYGFPLILAIGLGIAFSGGQPEPPKIDIQGSPEDVKVQALVKILEAAQMQVEVHDADECNRRLKRGNASLFIIPGSKPKFVFDEARAESVLARHWVAEKILETKLGTTDPFTEEPVAESGSRYIDFLLPGLIGMNIMGGGLFGVGFVLVDMRVRKLFKRLLATPMRRGDFLFAILFARLLFLVPEMLSLLLIGYFLFGVPIYGNVLVLILVIVMGAMMFNSIGLLVGCRTEKTETASGLMNLVMLPMYLLSGVFFSSKRFPDEIQPIIQALPLTQLNDALREVMLEGLSLVEIAWRLGIMLGWIALCLPLALRWFRWR
jgi:ABC-type multidrug transport system permease subunit